MNKFFFLAMFVLSGLNSSAQHAFANQDSLAKLLVEKHRKQNALHESMPGYRIQLYFGNDRNHALEMKTEFQHLYPKTGAYVVYHQPNFKLRVGDYKTRLEALKFLKELQPLYNTAFIVTDDVKLPDD